MHVLMILTRENLLPHDFNSNLSLAPLPGQQVLWRNLHPAESQPRWSESARLFPSSSSSWRHRLWHTHIVCMVHD